MDDFVFIVEKTKRSCQTFLNEVGKAEELAESSDDLSDPESKAFINLIVGLLPLSFAVDELVQAFKAKVKEKEVNNGEQE